jgi:hypothetical protein
MIQAIYSQKDLLITMQGCAKPADTAFLKQPVVQASTSLKNLKAKDPKFGNHVQTLIDGLNLFCWYLSPTIQEYVDESLANIDFYGNKVLQLKQEKDTAWQHAYKALVKAFAEFIISN